jgi:hypothetical protein
MRRSLAVALALCAACTSAPPAATPSTTPSASPSASVSRVPRFSVARAQATVRVLASLGPREASSDTYRRAATIVARTLAEYGYGVARERFDVPAGDVDGVAVGAGESLNVVATPPGFRPRRPHLVVGGHLDTVPDAPGANDNASGIAVMLELARLVAVAPTPLPVVFVALGAEERRRQSPDESVLTLGALAYLDRRQDAERAAIRGYLNLDMVGNGARVVVIGEGRLFNHTLARARRIDVPISLTSTRYFSDHMAFADAGISVSWLWSGDHQTLHTPQDVPTVVKSPALRRAGRLAWEVLRTFPRRVSSRG